MINDKLFNIWEGLRGSFWFLPSVMVVAVGLLAAGLLALDAAFSLEQFGPLQPLLYAGGTQATRGLLSTIASSMLTVAGTTFSITIAVLTLTASNYGPRLLQIFMQDRGNQFVLGTFVATFLYCLIVLRSISDVEDPRYVPHLSTSVAMLLAVVCVGVLIYFIHHIATSIQVATIVRNVGTELMDTIGRVFPEAIGNDAIEHDDLLGERDMPPQFAYHSVPIAATNSGYVQTIDDEALLRLTTKHDLVIEVRHQPGQFVVEGDPLVQAWPAERVDDDVRTQVNRAFALGKQRTMSQDVEFGMLQLEEIAVRALSPSLNDPYTAVNSLDQLSIALCTLAERSFPGRYRYDDQRQLRVIATPATFEHLLNIAFDQIRMNGNQFVMVLNKLLQVIVVVAHRVRDPDTLEALRQHAQLVEHSSHDKIQEEHDLQKVQQQYTATMRVIEEREAELADEVQQLAAR